MNQSPNPVILNYSDIMVHPTLKTINMQLVVGKRLNVLE